MRGQIVVTAMMTLTVLVGCKVETEKTVTGTHEKSVISTSPGAPVDHRTEIAAWQAKRTANLTKEDGWLSLVGLYWLKEGNNSVGSRSGSEVVVPGKAGVSGNLVLKAGEVTFFPSMDSEVSAGGAPPSNAAVKLKSDQNGLQDPTIISKGPVSFFVISRNEKFGVRVKDKESEARTKFAGLHYFPIDDKWRVVAKFTPYAPPKKVKIVNVLGMESDETSPGSLTFSIDGKAYTIDPILENGEKDYFLIIRDLTSGKETYGAARYLYAPPPGPDGTTVIDFNKAYNPPCAFTHFATCPLPPPQNRLPIAIQAGELKYEGPH